MKIIKKYAYAAALGGLLTAFGNVDFMMWEFYAVVVPVISLKMWGEK